MAGQSLSNTVTRILRQPGIQKIGFSLNGITVTGLGYTMVAQAIADGRIKCQTVDKIAPQGKLAAGMTVEARYTADTNVMLFQRADYGSNNVSEERTIVHESTHAMFDLMAKSKNARQLSIDDESAAVLAEALYTRLCDKPVGGFRMVVEGPQDEAMKVADNMMAERGNFETDRSLYILKADDIKMLRDAVAMDWNFTRVVDSKGNITDNRGALYIYNGVPLCKKRGN